MGGHSLRARVVLQWLSGFLDSKRKAGGTWMEMEEKSDCERKLERSKDGCWNGVQLTFVSVSYPGVTQTDLNLSTAKI